MFQISQTPLEAMNLKERFSNSKAGAFVTFEGWVRNLNDGKAVVSLEYEAFAELAQSEAEKILVEAAARFDILDAACIHRVGHLTIGEMAVWVGVNAQHRRPAFEACQYIIDEVKQRLPIWKKEFYANGDSGWVNCQHCASAEHTYPHTEAELTEAAFYSRQTILKEIGPQGQAKLKDSKVLVVGAGGLGSAALLYLAASGVGTLGICEFDVLDASNLHRQVLYGWQDIGKPKLSLASNRIQGQTPFVKVQTHAEKLTASNIESIFNQYDLVLDCTDNFVTKFLMSDAAVLTQTPLIQASIYQYEGQLHLYDGSVASPCLRCLWPQTPQAGCVGSCAEVGVLGVVPGVFGAFQVLEALKFLLNFPERLASDAMLIMDLRDYRIQRLKRVKNPDCSVCNPQNSLTYTIADNTDCHVDASVLAPQALAEYCLVDIREHAEKEQQPCPLPCLDVPGSEFTPSHPALAEPRNYLLFCQRGVRSEVLAQQLRAQGYRQFYSLNNGINALQQIQAVSPTSCS